VTIPNCSLLYCFQDLWAALKDLSRAPPYILSPSRQGSSNEDGAPDHAITRQGENQYKAPANTPAKAR